MRYEELVKELSSYIDFNEVMLDRLHRYAALLKEWNEKINLTTIVEEEDVIEKHFYDSLLPVKEFKFGDMAAVDIGTGAGFPGLVWAICLPQLQVTLVDATNKKCTFLKEVIKELSLGNVNVINSRSEDLKMSERFDIATARAVTALNQLLEITAPWVAEGGYVIALKSQKANEELKKASFAVKKLGLKLEKTQIENLPTAGERTIFYFKKIAPTPKKYPRTWGEIVSKPL
ncbi:MAG: 16S rRNA (guanine(527)-N(7))-methyltransferase RsmG [Bacilli bacterium]|nr:16S rRNA (guanine(527)-N(7))-methyltransferase RsmG [Bacilli bacterium]